jgi:hypothetical protein
MADDIIHELGIDLFDYLVEPRKNIEPDSENYDSTSMDDFLGNFLVEFPIPLEVPQPPVNPVESFPPNIPTFVAKRPVLPEEPQPPVNSAESSSPDIPTDPKEWLVTEQGSRRQRPPRLYEFLIMLLEKPHYASYASYKDKSQGVFEIHEPEKVANLWQQVKNRQSSQKMTYDNFARAVRWYYKGEIMKKTNARYTFQFTPKTLKLLIIEEDDYIAVLECSNVN